MNGLPGDIDLTENLDFRKVVKRELPDLPDSWKGNKLITDDSINLTWNSNDIISTYSTTTSNNIRINSYYISDWNYYHEDAIQYINIRNDSMSITYNISTSTNDYTLDTYYYDSYNASWTSSKNKIVSVSFKNQEDKCDVFGNKIKPEKEIPKIPWVGKEKYTYPGRKIPWELYYHRRFYNDDDYIEPIPWPLDSDWCAMGRKKYNLTDRIERAKHLICWLSDKTTSAIRKYFETEDDVDLSYLTNMNWIRVRDAIID